eukprot:scaffold6688_cov58-Phaeocystis_antarctica.AAC.1
MRLVATHTRALVTRTQPLLVPLQQLRALHARGRLERTVGGGRGAEVRPLAAILLVQQLGPLGAEELEQGAGRGDDGLVAVLAVLEQVGEQRRVHGERHPCADLTRGVDADGHHLRPTLVGDEVLREGAQQRLQALGGHELVAALHEVGEDEGDLPLVRLHVPLHKGVEVGDEQPVRPDEAREEVEHHEAHVELLALLAHLAEELLADGVRVVQQVDRREGGGRLPRRLLLGRGLRALELAHRLLGVARARGALLLQVLLHPLRRLARGGARVLVVRVGRRRLVVCTQEEVERRDAQGRVRAEERARHDVDGARVPPDVPAVELDQHAQRVLGGHDGGVVEHGEDVCLQPPVERIVLVLGVDALDVGDDVHVEPLAQDLVAAAEAAEAQLQQREGLEHPAVAQQHQRLEDGATHGRVERVELVVEERGELGRNLGGELREARAHGRDEAEQSHQLL